MQKKHLDLLIKQKKRNFIDTPNAYRNRKAQYPDLKDALHLYYCDIRPNNLPISDEIVLTKVKFF